MTHTRQLARIIQEARAQGRPVKGVRISAKAGRLIGDELRANSWGLPKRCEFPFHIEGAVVMPHEDNDTMAVQLFDELRNATPNPE